MRLRAVTVAALMLAGCAARHPVQPTVAAVEAPVDVSALITRGCFRCLEQALAAAERGNPAQAFEAAILLTLRAKELGLPYDSFLTRARTLAADDPARRVFVEIAAAIPPDPLSDDRDVLLTTAMPRPRLAAASREWRQAIASLPVSDTFREYVTLDLACAVEPFAQLEPLLEEALGEFKDVPLVRFRAALCGATTVTLLQELESRDAEFVEVNYPLGQYALFERPRPDYDVALSRLRIATAAFPRSPSMASVLGDVHQTREEWPDALAAYDQVIAMVPTHRDALLGRTIALSHLLRHEDAIAAATQLIDLGGWFIGQAHYWRAWNYFNTDRMAPARADVDRAKTLMVNAAVFLLSGLVEWRERRVDSAEREFEQAQRLDPRQCEASLYLGSVRVQLGRLPTALPAFTAAEACFAESIVARRALIADITAGKGSESVKAHLIDVQQRAIDEAMTHREEAARSAADLERRLKKTA